MSTPEVPPFDYPATFAGTIPCDDCLQVDIILNIRPDGLYQLRKTYQAEQGSGSIASQMGKWRYISDGNFLILGKEMGLLKTYVVEDRSRLTFVEWEGSENKSQIRYELTRSDPAPFDDVVKIRGMFGVDNGVATLKECASQVTFPVSPSGDYNSTLQNYMNTPHDMNKSILISILGRLVQHNREELVIEQFRKFYPNSDCQGNKIKTSLTGTHWQVLEIQNRKWSEITDKMAHLLLKRDKTIEGSSGCNKISGTYLVKGDVLLINRELVSRKACPGGMEGENLLVSVLDDVESYRIEGNILELIDQNDQVLARFLAGP
jgi:heat shock protein HslJ